VLVQGHMVLGQIEQGLEVTAEALQFVHETDERYWEAELYRLKGELLQMRGDVPAAEEAFDEAVRVARKQGARSLELRAAMSMCRVRTMMGRREEGRQMLEPIYRWFAEGIDTPDLREARMLLDQDSGEPRVIDNLYSSGQSKRHE
jgi:predicted ATPase